MHIVELKRGVLEITGRDRVRFLHNMCTNDIKALQPGGGCFAAMVTRQGKMVGTFQVKCLVDRFLLDGEPSAMAAVAQTMRKFVVMDDVTIEEREHRIVGVFGTDAPAGGRIVTRTIIGFEVWDDPVLQPTPGAAEAYEAARIEQGWPKWGVDMSSDHLPMEAGLERLAISYTKGCYIGQEVIQRVKTYSEPVRMLVSLTAESPLRCGPILAQGKPVGEATSVSGSIGLGMVQKEYKSPGTRVIVGDVPAQVGPLRWHP